MLIPVVPAGAPESTAARNAALSAVAFLIAFACALISGIHQPALYAPRLLLIAAAFASALAGVNLLKQALLGRPDGRLILRHACLSLLGLFGALSTAIGASDPQLLSQGTRAMFAISSLFCAFFAYAHLQRSMIHLLSPSSSTSGSPT
jgi:hypothetical protein